MGIVWPPENAFVEMAEWRAKNRFLSVTLTRSELL
jgi:hypothetical protein